MKSKIKGFSPVVSVLTKAYNVEKYIDECVQSVLNQTFQQFEWILLDNGCTDGTAKKLKEYAKKDSRIKLLRNETNFNSRGTPPEGLMVYQDLVEKSTGKYITDLDSDDFLAPTYLEEMVAAAETINADVTACGTIMFDNANPKARGARVPPAIATTDMSKLGDRFPEYYNVFRPAWGKLFKRDFYCGISRDYFQNVPDFLMNGSDTYLCLKILQAASSIVCIPKPLHFYRLNVNSIYYSHFYAKRYLSYDILHGQANQLLRFWKKDTKENTGFIDLVHLNSMQDCLDLAKRSDVDLKECLSFLHNICEDTVLQSYYFRLPSPPKETFEKQVFDLVGFLSEFKVQNNADALILYQSYLYRFYSLRKAPKEVCVGDILRYLSVVFDEQNKLKLGFSLFERYVQPLFHPVIFQELKRQHIFDQLCFCSSDLFYYLANNRIEEIETEAVSSELDRLILTKAKQIFKQHDYSYNAEKVNEIKERLSQEIESGNVSEIIRIMTALGASLLLDYDLLRLRTQLYLMSDDMENAMLCAVAGKIFFKDDVYFPSVFHKMENQI